MTDVSGYLLDTNVISETRKPRIDTRVLAFFRRVEAADLWLSVLTIGELQKGVAKQHRKPVAAMRVGAWVDGLEVIFADRILPVDLHVAQLWGRLSADRSRPVVDTMLAATAIAHNLALVTRNTSDVHGINVTTINPWADE